MSLARVFVRCRYKNGHTYHPLTRTARAAHNIAVSLKSATYRL
jgi:hypothetical protein